MPDHASGQPLPEWVTWDCCNQVYDAGTPCTGAAQSDYGRCLAHLDDTQLARVMTHRPDEAPPDLDVRGIRLARDDLRRLLAAARSEDRPLSLRHVSLDRATVEGGVSLDGATVKGDVSLDGATVNGEAFLGPMSLTGLSLVGTELTRLVSLDVTAKRVELSQARFLAGLTARVGDAEVAMERVEMQGPAVLASAAAGSVAPTSPPRLLQLAGTDVASLTLTGVDLTACHFSGAINLDKLHIDGSPQLGIRRGWRAHRKVLEEENEWWDKYTLSTDFIYNVFLYNALFDNSLLKYYSARAGARKASLARKRAHEIAGVYRALRKGREDGKDEPGAADFYYGEMEMRRKAAGGSVEGLLLSGYWLLSGYGLRAWRAFTALVALIAVATVLFATVGLARTGVVMYRPVPPREGTGAPSYVVTTVPGPRPGWATALNYSVQSTTSLLRSPPNPPPLTGFGQALEIFLRFAGPGLLALAVLALRARVKR